ncbi:MAG: TIM barrel protein [Minwuia sp.]|nr:TIM barrel protein [Minwuia sp.]
MPRFDANIDLLFTERPFLSRFQAARDAGIGAVEILFPYAHDRGEIAEAARAAMVDITLINTPMPNAEAGDIGCAAQPDRRGEFERLMAQALETATAIGAAGIHVMAGHGNPGDAAANDCLVANLKQAAVEAGSAGVRLMLEPLNTVDRPGYFLTTNDHACRLLDRIGAANVRLQFDAYHTQIMTGDLTRAFRHLYDRIGHIQIANPPDRHEPGVGEIDFDWFLRLVDAMGYPGPVGLEYNPATTTEASLVWFKDHGFL